VLFLINHNPLISCVRDGPLLVLILFLMFFIFSKCYFLWIEPPLSLLCSWWSFFWFGSFSWYFSFLPNVVPNESPPPPLLCSWWSSLNVHPFLNVVHLLLVLFLSLVLSWCSWSYQTFLSSQCFSVGAFELGTMEFLLVIKPLSYYSYNFYLTLLPQLLLLLH